MAAAENAPEAEMKGTKTLLEWAHGKTVGKEKENGKSSKENESSKNGERAAVARPIGRPSSG
jgi:hypothetical protein